MNINEITLNSKLHLALLKSGKLKNPNHYNMQSGRFPNLPRFTKLQNYLLESLYTVSDLHNPSAYRLYLYLFRQIIGYEGRSNIEFRPKKIKAELNMGSAFYKAVRLLKAKNMIRYVFFEDTKFIGLNPYPESWITNSKDRIDAIVDNEINELLEIQKDTMSSNSSSYSSSSTSSSSESSPCNDDDLLRELDTLDDPMSKYRVSSYKKPKPPKPIDPDLLAILDTM